MYDPKEVEMPNVGLMRVVDAETNEAIWLDTARKKVRTQYHQWYQNNYNQFRATFLKCGADLMSISTDESYVNALLKFFRKR